MKLRIEKMMPIHYLFLFAILSLLTGCGGDNSASSPDPIVISSSSQSSIAEPYHYLGSIEPANSITSNFTGITYPYHIYLPKDYSTSGKNYSILYGTDGQWNFDYFSQIIDKFEKPFIYVGIEQGPLNSNQRAIDYTNIGADRYIQFLKNEFIPLIESHYRTNNERSFIGTSYGGLLGSILLSRENVGTPYFKNYLLFDGSFWAQTNSNLLDEETRYAASKEMPIHLIITSANSPGNEASVNTFQTRYSERHYLGMKIDRKYFSIAHNDVADPSFLWSIDLIP